MVSRSRVPSSSSNLPGNKNLHDEGLQLGLLLSLRAGPLNNSFVRSAAGRQPHC